MSIKGICVKGAKRGGDLCRGRIILGNLILDKTVFTLFSQILRLIDRARGVGRLVGVGGRLGSGNCRRRNLALVLQLLQSLGTGTVAGTVDAASAEWQRHPQARNVIVAREGAAVVNAATLRLLLNASLHRDAKSVTLEAQAKQVLLGKVGDGEEGLSSNILLGQAEESAAVVDTAAFRPLAVARREVAEASLARNNVRGLSSRVASSSLRDIQRHVEVGLLDRAADSDFAAEALTIDLQDTRGHHQLASTSTADKASFWVLIDELAALGLILNTQALGGGLGTPAVLELEVRATEGAASQTK